MPSLNQSRQPLPNNYVRVARPTPPIASQQPLEPTFNTYLRCPLPPINATPDTLRQFYRGGQFPQSRILTPAVLSGNNNSSGSAVGTSTTTATTSSSSSTTPAVAAAQTASVSSPVLNPGDTYFATATMAKTFDLISLTMTNIGRVRMYSTAASQSLDVSRSADTPPAAGITQGLIADVVLDTAPLYWLFTWVPTGVNGDSPRSKNIYITFDNVDVATHPIGASFLYLPTE